MGKHKSMSNRKTGIIIIILLVILLALLVVFVIPQALYNLSGDDSSEVSEPLQTEQAAETEPQPTFSADSEVSIPATLEDGKLELVNLFPFSGINPDCGLEEADDVASITLKNNSEQYLSVASIIVTLSDGTECKFTVTDLPAGTSTMAFATENQVMAPDVFCAGLSSEASFEDIGTWDQLAVSMVGTTITLQNISSENLSNIDVYCHDSFGESYFGGITYKYTVNELPAGQTATIDVSDSLMGMVDVVRIAINES